MNVYEYPYRARAWLGQTMVADSGSCLCLDEEGKPATLYFPPGDIRLELFRNEVRRMSAPEMGEVELLSVAAAAGAVEEVDGQEILCRLSGPTDSFRRLAGFSAFDQGQVRVDIVDGREGDDARDVTIKQFPTWGDAADLIDLLDVRPDGGLSSTTIARSDGRRPVVEGSQMLAQAIVAAGRHAAGRRVVSANMIFVRPADARRPLSFELEEVSAGKVFSGLSVQVHQGGRRCALGTLLLNVTSPDVIRHAVDPPPVASPYECQPYDMGVTGRDIRVVDGAYGNDPEAPVGPPILDTWVRFRNVPEDPALHAGLLAQFTGHLSIAAALRPHEGVGQDQAHRSLSTAINGIAISFHGDVRADRWMLYHHHSTFAGDGMTHSECRVHDEPGHLIASFTVEAMVRPFPRSAATLDERTAL
jgi:acyl-CoA thioesterase-2